PREHRSGSARRREPRRRQRLVRRGTFGGAVPDRDRERPAALPAADGIRADDDRRIDPARARSLPGSRAARALPHELGGRRSLTRWSGRGAGRLRRALLAARVSLAADDDPDGVHRLVADRPEPVRRGGVERDRPAGLQLVLLEANADAEGATRDVAVLLPAVRHQRVLRAGFGADGIRDVKELDITV